MKTANTAIANTAIATVEIDNTAWTLTPTSVALMGHELAAPTYGVAKDGDVYVYTAVEGSALRLHFDMRESLRYPWIDADGRECYCDGFRCFRLNNPLRLVERPENAGTPVDLGRIYPDSLAGWKELPMPTIAEIKAHIALQKANGVERRSVLWRFGEGKPTVCAVYLLDAAMVFPDADKLYWNTIITPLVIGGRDGDGLILPVRTKGATQPEAVSDEERQAREAYDAKVEANRQEDVERTRAICRAHDREQEANKAMDEAAARCQTLEKGVKNAY